MDFYDIFTIVLIVLIACSIPVVYYRNKNRKRKHLEQVRSNRRKLFSEMTQEDFEKGSKVFDFRITNEERQLLKKGEEDHE